MGTCVAAHQSKFLIGLLLPELTSQLALLEAVLALLLRATALEPLERILRLRILILPCRNIQVLVRGIVSL